MWVGMFSAERMLGLAVGILAGLIALQMQGLELRWIVIPMLGFAAATFIFIVPNKEAVISAAFVLSLQANLNLRLLYGHAGSTGLSVPITVVIGIALLALYF